MRNKTILVALAALTAVPFCAQADESTVLRSSSDDFSLMLGGRIQADYATYFNKSVIAPNGKVSDIMGPAGAKLRRARIFTAGKIADEWKFKFQYEFTDSGAAGFRDAYFAYTGVMPGNTITLGQSKTFFTMDQLNSSNDNVFMERPLLEGLDTYGDRRMGLKITQSGDNWMLGLGGFMNALDEKQYTKYSGVARTAYTSQQSLASISNTATNQSGIYTISGRATYVPVHAKGSDLYFGANLNYTGFGDKNAAAFYGTRPETSVSGTKLLEAYVSNPSSQFIYTLETAAVAGPFSIEGAYVGTNVSRRLGLPTASFNGYYVQASYILTGQSRNFKPKLGEFHYLKDIGKGGAWEVALRYDRLNLNDANAGIYGGRGYNLTAGLNWYANEHVRLMLDYSHAHVGDIPGTQPAGATWWNDPKYNTDLNLVQFRGQFLF
ncbi:porin [Igneacidithiobacillus siniensis]|uniref:OprO/OprP family phosphate-selective porin n=1 Tax=Acidithiobacillus TaxID=119977 RepID=UPI00200C41A3|nr:porin [Acidithiobacillus sp. S30A2]